MKGKIMDFFKAIKKAQALDVMHVISIVFNKDNSITVEVIDWQQHTQFINIK